MKYINRLFSTFLLVMVASCGPHELALIEPAPPNDLLTRFTMLRLNRSQSPVEITSEIEVVVNSGFVAHFNFEPRDSIPQQFAERDVVPCVDWGMMVTISPRDLQNSAKDTIFNPVTPLHATHHPGPVNRGSPTALWTECGFTSIDLPKGHVAYIPIGAVSKEKKLTYWTYICGPKDTPGEYVYEVRLLPTGAWLTAFREEYGEPVVLKRGLLRVLPKESE